MSELCYYCNEPTCSFAGDAGLWPLYYSHEDDPGVVKPHHVKCVQQMERDAIRWQFVRNEGFTPDKLEAPVWRDIADTVIDSRIKRADAESALRTTVTTGDSK